MKARKPLGIVCLLAAMAPGLASTSAADKTQNTNSPTALTAAGEKLQARYAAMLTQLQAEIARALPDVDDQKKTALSKTREALKRAEVAADAAQQPLKKVQRAKALVDHARGKWIGDAEKNIARAEALLKKATTPAERDAARKELARWQANRDAGIKALKERQEALIRAKSDEAGLTEASQAAQKALAEARINELTAAKAILTAVEPFLSSDRLDGKLVKCAVLAEATPRRLAEFAQMGQEQEALVDKLLADTTLMKEMLEAGGAKGGTYGPAMQIYTAIQKASPRAGTGLFQRLALGTSLEHAVPILSSNPRDQTNAPDVVDPVKRYLHYEKAYLDGELDHAFKNMSVWEYRMIVNSDAPDEMLAWGRQMLRNYRPDHISTPNDGWRYAILVKTDVKYGSENVKDDLPSLHNYQNIIKDGGVCGRRAFFGRFILRSFGIPVYGVTQHKHAAVGRWTPKGWVVNLGAGWESSWWDHDAMPRSGTDFLLETQARKVPQDYLKVLRAQWISTVLGEQRYNDRKHVDGGFWSNLAHYQAQAIAAAAGAVELAPVGKDVAESNESKERDAVQKVEITDADRKIVVAPNGVITIPAVALSKPEGRFLSMKNPTGEAQLHCPRDFKAAQEFAYTFEAPQAGKYALVARVVTVQTDQKLLLRPNEVREPVAIAVPYTLGQWQQTQPVEIELVKGRNVLHFTRPAPSRGVTLKDFTLTPVK